MTSAINTWVPLIQTRWRQGRRLFDSRLLNERRLIVLAIAGLAWFVLDTVLVTPSFKGFHEATQRTKTATEARDTLREELNRRKTMAMVEETKALQEIKDLEGRIERSKQALQEQQAMLVPAREMRALLEGLLYQSGQLRLHTMRTLPPEAVKFAPVPGVSVSQAWLYRQGMEVSVEGSFMDLLAWLRSLESMPRKLLWDGLTLASDDKAHLILTLTVHTFSPDRDALEIAP